MLAVGIDEALAGFERLNYRKAQIMEDRKAQIMEDRFNGRPNRQQRRRMMKKFGLLEGATKKRTASLKAVR